MTRQDRAEEKRYADLRAHIYAKTKHVPKETKQEKEARIRRLLANPVEFFKYYFPHYMSADFGWFHRELIQKMCNDDSIWAIAEWPREHAKSVLGIVFISSYLKASGYLKGLIVCSQTESKAKRLMMDLKAELSQNQKYIADFGEQLGAGDIKTSTHFVTNDGCGFWAIGRGQSPRGFRVGERRPNIAVIDDIDDGKLVRNQVLVKECVDWVYNELYAALSIQGSKVLVSGNRIHPKSVLAHLVGDTEPEKPKKKGIFHLKVYALENPKTKEADKENGVPAWKENYTKQQLKAKWSKMPNHSVGQEYFHENIPQGLEFKESMLRWRPAPKDSEFDGIVMYGDPSFTSNSDSDYKFWAVVGRKKNQFFILAAWAGKTHLERMAEGYFDLFDRFGMLASAWMESNATQEIFWKPKFKKVSERLERIHFVRPDRTKKIDKKTRIRNTLIPLFERGVLTFDSNNSTCPYLRLLEEMLLDFPRGKDDGPDALEGAIAKLSRKTSTGTIRQLRMGQYKRNRQ